MINLRKCKNCGNCRIIGVNFYIYSIIVGLIIWISILKSVVWKVDGSNDGWMDGFFSVMDESN